MLPSLPVLILLVHALLESSLCILPWPLLSTTQAQRTSLMPRAPASRKAWLIIKLDPTMFESPTGLTSFAQHSYLWVEGTEMESALKIDIQLDQAEDNPEDVIPEAVVEERQYNADKETPTEVGLRKTFEVGEIEKTNADFLTIKDDTGAVKNTGIVLDAVKKDPTYRIGATNEGRLNACHHFISTIITDFLDLEVPDAAKPFWEAWDQHTIITPEETYDPLQIEKTTHQQYNGKGIQPTILGEIATPPEWCSPSRKGRRLRRTGQFSKPVRRQDVNYKTGLNELALEPSSARIPVESMQDDDFGMDDDKVGAEIAKDVETKTSSVRSGGALTTFTTVSKSVLNTLEVAGAVIGAAFVIIDFVDHHWVGGAIGAVGLTAGLAAGFAISGPLGWVVGGIIMALFAILPGLFEKQHDPAERSDTQGIIQWQMFGDKKHTGNEQCQKGTKDIPGNKDCQALYGPGTLSMVLGVNNFDAIVFLQHFNDGYAMTIPDMARSFYVIDPNKQGDGDDKPAVIECHNRPGVLSGKAGVVTGQDDPKLCADPAFKINRALIKLPNIDQTADKVFDRITPAANGDCKLVAYPGDQIFPQYGLKVNGLPSAIACGLTAAIDVDGVAVPIDGDTKKNAELGSDASQATDSQGGAYVDPPPVTPFKPLDFRDYGCIAHKTDPPICLPPGKYRKQSHMGLEISKIDGMTLPSGLWNFSTHWRDVKINHHDKTPRYFDRTYRQNQYFDKGSQELDNFKIDMRQINANYQDDAFFEITGPNDGPDPVCCLFSLPSFNGNVWCAGVGGGDVLPQWKNEAQSVSCHAGANVWLYANSYGDIGGALVKGDVEDLKNQPYGNKKGTFSKKVKAMWILKPE